MDAQQEERAAFAAYAPDFYEAVADFPDFVLAPPLSTQQISVLEKNLEFSFSKGMAGLLSITSGVTMNGLSLAASGFGSILMPNSEALVTGYFYLHNPGDRLLMLPNDEAMYYLEQRNGSVTKLADNVREFFNSVLPRHLYG